MHKREKGTEQAEKHIRESVRAARLALTSSVPPATWA
jgi:hypothetical protein